MGRRHLRAHHRRGQRTPSLPLTRVSSRRDALRAAAPRRFRAAGRAGDVGREEAAVGRPRLTNKMRHLGYHVNLKRFARRCREGRLLLTRRKGRQRVAVEQIPRVVPDGRTSGGAWTSCMIAWPTGMLSTS